jgi:hypothetical protein
MHVSTSLITCAKSPILQSRIALHAAHPEWSTGEPGSADLLGLKSTFLEHAEMLAVHRELKDTVAKALSPIPPSSNRTIGARQQLTLSSHGKQDKTPLKPNRSQELLDKELDSRVNDHDPVECKFYMNEINGCSEGKSDPDKQAQEQHFDGTFASTLPKLALAGPVAPQSPRRSELEIQDALPDAGIALQPKASHEHLTGGLPISLQSDGVSVECYQENHQPQLPFGEISGQRSSASGRQKHKSLAGGRQLAQAMNIALPVENLNDQGEQAGDEHLQGYRSSGLSGALSPGSWVEKASRRRSKEGDWAYSAAEQRLKVPALLIK